jgi:hypothetical protein
MVKTEVSARVSSWLRFLNRSGLIGKRGNIPSGERAAGWRKWGGNGSDSQNRKGVLPDSTSDFLFIGTTRLVENNPVHSRTVVDSPTENASGLVAPDATECRHRRAGKATCPP